MRFRATFLTHFCSSNFARPSICSVHFAYFVQLTLPLLCLPCSPVWDLSFDCSGGFGRLGLEAGRYPVLSQISAVPDCVFVLQSALVHQLSKMS